MPWERESSDQLVGRFYGALRTTNGEMMFSHEEIGLGAALRAYCHIAISRLPLKGLEEMAENLTDAIEFYGVDSEHKSVEAARRSVSGNLVRSIERPASYF